MRDALRRSGRLSWVVVWLTAAGLDAASGPELAMLSLEELMDIEVELLSRHPERVSDVPAAIHVLTADDLRRTGARTLPEALRHVPGMHVGRVDANKWAVTARGFNSLFANKLLVLIDGRIVYTPAFSGVFWEAQDVIMADVERVEVICGPGGTLWGANAVNGIINVVTRPAAETSGTYVEVGSGLRERLGLTVRHSRALGASSNLRLYARHFDRGASVDTSGTELSDDWRVTRLGFRWDRRLSAADDLTLQGEIYDGDIGEGLRLVTQLTPPYVSSQSVQSEIRGGHVMGVWKRRLAGGGDWTVRAVYDRSRRADPPALDGVIDIVDVDFQHRQPFADRAVTWGAGYRGVSDDVEGSFSIRIVPEQRRTHLFSGFLHGDGPLGDHLGWAAGTKVEHNSYTGFEVQPSARLWWRPAPRHMLWAAVSRAVRTPSRGDDDMEFAALVVPTPVTADSTLPTLFTYDGDRRLEAENLIAVEAGYRAHPLERLSLDAAVFRHRYTDLRTSEPSFPVLRHEPAPTHFYAPLTAANRGRGTTIGLEGALTWQAAQTAQLRATYTLLKMDLRLARGSSDPLFLSQERELPRHQGSVRWLFDLTTRTELDVVARFADELPAQPVPRYATLDVRLGWQLSDAVQLSLTGHHLLDSPHSEYAPQVTVTEPSQVEADVHAALAWRF